MQCPLVSVIIPCYNVDKYVIQCLESIDRQTYCNYEVIIVDDGSTDETVSIVENYIESRPRFVLVKRKNGGASAARNTGIEKATGEWIVFIDADDWVDPEYLDVMVSAVLTNSADTCMVGAKSFDEYGKETIYTPASSKVAALNEDKLCTGLDLFSVWGKVYKTEILYKNNIRFMESLQVCEDTLFCIQYFCYVNKFVCLDCYPYHYRINLNGLSHGNNRKMVSLDYILELNKLYVSGKPNIVNSAFPDNKRLIRAFGESLINAFRKQVDEGSQLDSNVFELPFCKQIKTNYSPEKSKVIFWYLLKNRYYTCFKFYEKLYNCFRKLYWKIMR